MKSKSQLILCDACVIIELFKKGFWEHVINAFDVMVSSVIVDEVKFYFDEKNKKISIDLESYVNNGQIKEISVLASETKIFFDQANIIYKEKLDAGELELLTYLSKNKEMNNMRICSGDAVVYKMLGQSFMSEKGVSLEELLLQINIKKSDIDYQFTKKWKEQRLQEGLQNSIIT